MKKQKRDPKVLKALAKAMKTELNKAVENLCKDVAAGEKNLLEQLEDGGSLHELPFSLEEFLNFAYKKATATRAAQKTLATIVAKALPDDLTEEELNCD